MVLSTSASEQTGATNSAAESRDRYKESRSMKNGVALATLHFALYTYNDFCETNLTKCCTSNYFKLFFSTRHCSQSILNLYINLTSCVPHSHFVPDVTLYFIYVSSQATILLHFAIGLALHPGTF